MKRIVITAQEIADYPHKNSKHSPTRPYCRLCANFDRRVFVRHGHRITRFHVHVFAVGEEAIKCRFRNGTIAYYSISCWEDPDNAERVKGILKQDVS